MSLAMMAVDSNYKLMRTSWPWFTGMYPREDLYPPGESIVCRSLGTIGWCEEARSVGKVTDEEYEEILHWHHRDGDMSAKDIIVPHKAGYRNRPKPVVLDPPVEIPSVEEEDQVYYPDDDVWEEEMKDVGW